MADASSSTSDTQPRSRGRGRGKSRGGLGKYLRARGRGRSYGRPAEFAPRLVLDGEAGTADDPEEEETIRQRYAKRTLVSNADRYAEEEPQLDSDGEEILEPEVDLSAFLERQRLSTPEPVQDAEEDEIDHELEHMTSRLEPAARSKKGRVQTIEWDNLNALEEMQRDKAVAEANRDLKERFRAKTSTLRAKPMAPKERRKENDIVEAPPLPVEGLANSNKDPKSEMQDFLDDLLG